MLRDTILIVDDEEMNLLTLEDFLIDDYNVLVADSGDKAIELLRVQRDEAPVRLIISDQRMPGMSGVEFLVQARHLVPHAKRVLLTAYTDPASLIDAINRAQVYQFVHKPFDPVGLQMLIQRALDAFHLEAERRRLTSELEALKADLQDRIRIATEVAIGASKSKTLFLRSMSHELRTPLNAILGHTQLLLTKLQDTSIRESIETIDRSGRHLLELLNDVLDLSRIEAGKFELSSAPMRLRGFVEDVVAMFGPSAQAAGLTLRVECDPELPEGVEGDARRLRQILLNLIGNALKFTQEGGVEVRARQSGDQLHIEVKDTGPGIDADSLRRIFTAFEQAGPDAQRANGTGLGLALARQMARQMGGGLTAASVVGQGSVFTLVVPLKTCRSPGIAVRDSLRGRMPVDPPASAVQLEQTAALPSLRELREFLALAERGDMTGVAMQAAAIARARTDLAPFADRLIMLARDFDDLGVETLLQTALERATS